MNKGTRILRYQRLYKNSEGRKIEIQFIGKNKKVLTLTGKIIKVRKSSLRLLIGDEAGVNVQFWKIHYSIFLASCNSIRIKLYY